MVKRLLGILLLLLLLCVVACGETLGVYPYTAKGTSVTASYASETLQYTVERFRIGPRKGTDYCYCYVTKVWMANPAAQIKKANALWGQALEKPERMAEDVPDAALVINGSGYISPRYPDIPGNYPGESADYYYTTLGSLVVTNGEMLRRLQGVPFYGLTLEADGLHMYAGADVDEVLSRAPSQSWAFYERCALIDNHQSVVDRDWDFARKRAIRTIIAQMDANNYLLLTATSTYGLSLTQATDWLMETFNPVWAYNLDGGPSSALLCRVGKRKALTTIFGGTASDADVMVFTELSPVD